jgi:hypothetical protein
MERAMNDKKPTNLYPVLYSVPIVERLALPARAEVLPKIESGEIEHIDFRAKVFTNGLNRNPYRFMDADMTDFSASFEGQPFLRDHDTAEIESRDGMILSSFWDGSAMQQDIRLTTRRGMMDFVEGRIDRFSIGWFYDDCLCSICNTSWYSKDCQHWVGAKYQTLSGEQTCELIFVNPKGKEVSAVNAPAVEGTGVIAQLSELKREYLANETKGELSQGDPKNNDGQEPVVAQEGPALERERASRERWSAVAKANHFDFGGNAMNVREMLDQRAKLLAEAEGLAELADTENRDLSEEERARFNAILGAEGELTQIDAKIKVIQDERARLSEAQAQKFTLGSAAEKPATPAPAEKNSMKRAEFDALGALEKAAWIKAGKTIED